MILGCFAEPYCLKPQSIMRKNWLFAPLASAFAIALACLTSSHIAAWADDWPQWRGPNHNGISSETQWSDHWLPDGPPILWKANVGVGFSSFSVAKGRVYTMGNSDNRDTVFCFDEATGKQLWSHSYPADLGDKYFDGGTTGTPTVGGDRVFTLSRWGDVFCLEAATGKVIWTRNVQKETRVRIPTWGFSGSPLVFENSLVLTVGEAGMALDKGTFHPVTKRAERFSSPTPALSRQCCGRTKPCAPKGTPQSCWVAISTGSTVIRAKRRRLNASMSGPAK
jgi:hypothetical protein